MKRNFIVSFILLLGFFASAQSTTTKKRNGYYGLPYVLEVLYGYTIYQSAPLGWVNTFNAFRFGRPVKLIGLQGSYFAYNIGPYTYKGALGFYKLLPEKVKINDSTTSTLGGFSFSMDLFTRIFYKNSQRIKLKVALGFAAGQIKLLEDLNRKNPFFAPQLSIAYNYRVKKVAFSFGAAYFYDVSNKDWKEMRSKPKIPAELLRFRQTGLRVNLGLG